MLQAKRLQIEIHEKERSLLSEHSELEKVETCAVVYEKFTKDNSVSQSSRQE